MTFRVSVKCKSYRVCFEWSRRGNKSLALKTMVIGGLWAGL